MIRRITHGLFAVVAAAVVLALMICSLVALKWAIAASIGLSGDELDVTAMLALAFAIVFVAGVLW